MSWCSSAAPLILLMNFNAMCEQHHSNLLNHCKTAIKRCENSMYKDEWWHCCTACVRPCSHLTSAIAFYRPQTKFAKVMFLQVSVCPQRGGDMCGCSGGGGGCAWLLRGHEWLLGGHAWLLRGGMHGCSGGHAWFFLGGVHVFFRGHAWFFPGGMHGFFPGGHGFFWGGHAWFFLGGMHGFFLGGHHRIRRDTVNEQAVRILLECILVSLIFAVKCRY